MIKTEKSGKIVLAIIIIITLSVLLYFWVADESTATDLTPEAGNTNYNYTGGVQLSLIEERSPIWNNITQDYRPIYPDMNYSDYDWIFNNLPPFPKDFFALTSLVYKGKLLDFNRIAKEYWIQPEFYQSWYKLYESDYLDNNPNNWCPEGYGCFPLIKEAIVERGTTAKIDTFFRTGFAVEAYQGIIIHPYLPEAALSLDAFEIFAQPDNAEQYLDVSIATPDNPIYASFKDTLLQNNVGEEDAFFLLKPTYQKVYDKQGNIIGHKGFPADWVRELTIEIVISPSTPVGEYVVAIEFEVPCFAINQEFYYSQNHEYFLDRYNPVGRIYNNHIPHFQAILHVT